MDIILSTRNPSKALQIKAIFNIPNINLHTLDEAGIDGEAIEDGTTLAENALKKAVYAKKEGHWTMADDTGLFIDALNGEPGIYAARWLRENAPVEETLAYCLSRLEGIENRRARFETVVALIDPNGKEYLFAGEVSGAFLESARTKPQPKMPYSAIFVPDGSEKVWAEMSTDEENAISHRGKAFRSVLEFLQNLK